MNELRNDWTFSLLIAIQLFNYSASKTNQTAILWFVSGDSESLFLICCLEESPEQVAADRRVRFRSNGYSQRDFTPDCIHVNAPLQSSLSKQNVLNRDGWCISPLWSVSHKKTFCPETSSEAHLFCVKIFFTRHCDVIWSFACNCHSWESRFLLYCNVLN